MEVTDVENKPLATSKQCNNIKAEDLEITSNWNVVNEKLLYNTISSVDFLDSPDRANLEDVVSLETCIRLEGNVNEKSEPCTINIKLNNGQKIARIAIVSEAFLIELYKQFGEYVNTVHAEFIDDFEQSAVYFVDERLSPPTSEISIKFARLKNPQRVMWLYGIRMSLTRPKQDNSNTDFDCDAIGELLQNKARSSQKSVDQGMNILEKAKLLVEQPRPDLNSFMYDFMNMTVNSPRQAQPCFSSRQKKSHTEPKKEHVICMGDSKTVEDFNLKSYIDDRLIEMESRLMQRIDVLHCTTNEKLDNIIKLLVLKQQSLDAVNHNTNEKLDDVIKLLNGIQSCTNS